MTEQQKKRLEYLKMLVSIRVEEYFESPQEEDTSIPFGDIEYELNQAARYVMRHVPRNISFFGSKSYDYGVAIEVTEKNGALIPLPSDYLRFTRFKMQGWSLSVNEYLSDVSKAYQQQQFEMRRGTNEKPVAFLVPYDQKYESGDAPAILCIPLSGAGSPQEADQLKDGSGNVVALVSDNGDPDYVYIQLEDGTAYNPAVGDDLTHPESSEGAGDGYVLSVRYLQGASYYRTSKSKQALEVYPCASGQIETLDYVPYMKSYELPEEFEDVLVWRAASTVLVTMRRINDSKAALEQMAIAESAINTGIYGEERLGNG